MHQQTIALPWTLLLLLVSALTSSVDATENVSSVIP